MPATLPQRPRRIGPYVIRRQLQRGGMGVVFEATDAHGRSVALKLPRGRDPAHRAALSREVAILSVLRSRRFVRVLDAGCHAGTPWLAMPLLRGRTLRSHQQALWRATPRAHQATTCRECMVDSASLPRAAAGNLPKAVTWSLSIALALLALHEEGYRHGDLKPENVMIVRGRALLIDFGLAAALDEDGPNGEATSGRGTLGTLTYMAPEQLSGGVTDARGDLYALGCVLYELLVGAPPFSGARHQVRYQHLFSSPLPLSMLVEGVPRSLSRLVSQLVQKRPEARPRAEQVVAQLARVAARLGSRTEFAP